MIAYPRADHSEPATPPTVRIIGLGNAGVHLADRLTMSGLSGMETVAMNTDAQSLASSVATRKITLGQKVTRGLGAGGDPEVGYEAAEEALEDIRRAVEGAQLLFVCAGLGGGTGSGAAAMVASAAMEAGAVVVALVTSPFTFEGRRRSAQSSEALATLARHAHAVLHFENDRMAELSSPRSGIEETFAAADATLAAAVVSLVEILSGGGPMPVGLGSLLAAIGGGAPAGLFGRGESSGDNRAHEALERALKSPLLDRGRVLSESHAVVAHISGPPSLSFSEVAAIMRELDRHTSDEAKLFLGVHSRPETSAPVTVTLLGSYATSTASPAAPVPRIAVSAPPVAREPAPPPVAIPVPVEDHYETAEPTEPSEVAAVSATASDDVDARQLFPEPAEEPVLPVERPAARPAPKPAAKPVTPPKVKQENLPFESVTRGRFEKSEPTIVEGEDLDVPTFLRMRGKN